MTLDYCADPNHLSYTAIMIIEVPQSSWLALFTHLKKWATNLRRAKLARKAESTEALQDVNRAVRKTAVYLRQINRRGQRAEEKEEELSLLWTNLGFKLEELKLSSLARKCQISGKHWSDPEHYSPEFLQKADVSLESIEKLALVLLQEIKRKT